MKNTLAQLRPHLILSAMAVGAMGAAALIGPGSASAAPTPAPKCVLVTATGTAPCPPPIVSTNGSSIGGGANTDPVNMGELPRTGPDYSYEAPTWEKAKPEEPEAEAPAEETPAEES
ncbi:hypothetical protein SEA_EVAA_82 [Gordonia phage Evaa]|nr:hypothetical protein SEA_EVAA_82 [Gordonia phage Evaa]